MLKKTLFTSAFILTTLSRAGQLSIKDSSIFSPKELGIVSLTRDSEGFHVIQNGVKRSVKNHWVDKTLRSIPSDKMEKFLQHGYISVNKMSDGDFTLNAKVRGNGGAYFGAVVGCYMGKFVVHFVGHGAILVASAATGPAAPATAMALEAVFLPWIEATSNVAAVGAGIAFGVAIGLI
ncbi:MAG: hypothetical protein WC707_01600 [Candidatus Babeliaceae bacterium]|jgi:hypothetical protein